MCGIFSYISKNATSVNQVFNGLKDLEYRGYDSWGIAWVKDNQISIDKHLGKINIKPNFPDSCIAIGHTRWATHGGITLDNCHPHFDCQKEIVVVHNGIIENYQELKKDLIKKNHTFISETDSEVISHLIEELGSVGKAFSKLDGLNAIVVYKKNTNELTVAKNGSPLVIGVDKNINYIASDPNPLYCHTNKFIFLEDGQIANISYDKIEIFNIKTKQKIKNKITIINNKNFDASLNHYSSYLIKEISEQPKILEIINRKYDVSALEKIFELIKQKEKVFFTGCGTAYFAAQFNANILSHYLKKPIFCTPASEFMPYIGSFDKKSLLVAFSQSGETADLINLFKLAKPSGILLTSLVNVPYSTLHRISTHCQLLPCGPEKCVLSTKSFTAQISLFQKMIDVDLKPAITCIKKIINNHDHINKLAKILSTKEHIYLIGRGVSLAITFESALKIKEVSYIHADAFAGAELKHGSIALIDKGTPCIVLAPNDDTYQDIISNATEIKARGGYIIGLSEINNPVFDYHIPISNCGIATSLPQIVSMQLLAYHLSQIKGLDPDKPRNLAKSVTVK